MQEEIKINYFAVDNNLGENFVKIMSNTDKSTMSPFMKLFWEEQQKYLSSKTGVRYHQLIIRYCLGLAAKSPAVYEEIRYNENTNSVFLILPSLYHINCPQISLTALSRHFAYHGQLTS